MHSSNSRQVLGVSLVLIGVFWLLYRFDWIQIQPELIIASLFLLSGVLMFSSYARAPQVWKLFVGMLLIFISIPIFNEALNWFADDLVGVIFLWMLGFIFLWIYARDHSQWWAIIPGGIFVTIGVMVMMETMRFIHHSLIPAIFFLGFAATFGFLYLIRSPFNKTGWAIWPAGTAFAIAVFIIASELDLLNFDVMGYLLPVGMIVIGIYLVYRSYRQANGDSEEMIRP